MPPFAFVPTLSESPKAGIGGIGFEVVVGETAVAARRCKVLNAGSAVFNTGCGKMPGQI